jgi:hypothetical protein
LYKDGESIHDRLKIQEVIEMLFSRKEHTPSVRPKTGYVTIAIFIALSTTFICINPAAADTGWPDLNGDERVDL